MEEGLGGGVETNSGPTYLTYILGSHQFMIWTYILNLVLVGFACGVWYHFPPLCCTWSYYSYSTQNM